MKLLSEGRGVRQEVHAEWGGAQGAQGVAGAQHRGHRGWKKGPEWTGVDSSRRDSDTEWRSGSENHMGKAT